MAKKRDKQLLLYQAALKVFARYGFHRARLEDIADELGMKKASLYTYIKNKQELYEKTIENALLDWQKTAKDACFRLDDPVDQLTAYATKGVEYLSKNEALRTIIMEDPSIFPVSKKKDRFSEINRDSVRVVETILQSGIDSDHFCDIDVKQTAELLFAVYVLFINKIYVDSEGRTFMDNFKDSLRIIFYGLLKRD